MPIPTGKQDVYGLVERWYTRLTALDIGATETSAALATNAAPVVLLYMRTTGFQAAVADLQALALPVETLVTILDEMYRLGAEATAALLTDYVAIRDTIVPDLRTWIEARSGTLGNLAVSPGLSLPPLSAEDQAELAVKLAALSAQFA